MIRKLLYRFRRLALVWRLDRLERRSAATKRLQTDLYGANIITRVKIAKLDATEMSKGEA